MKKILYFVLIFAGFTETLYAQVPVKISEEFLILNNKKFYLHRVEPGQTLFSLSKAYKVSQEDIISANNLESSTLKAGDLLKIPYVKNEKKNDTSPDFFYHKVIQGETLFSLSQKYYVSVEDIINTNPEVKYGLKAGQILKIPNSFKKNREKNEKNKNAGKYFFYKAEPGNTLYFVSKKFNITIEELIKLNPELKDGLKAGQILKIPEKENLTENITGNSGDSLSVLQTGLNDPLYFTEEGITPCMQFKYRKDSAFNAVLLLPLFLEQNLHYISRYHKEKDPMFYKNTKRFTEFYEGVLLALDKLREQGLSVNLSVFDTENNPEKVRNIMNSLKFPDVDLIIGPVYSSNVRIAYEYANKHHVNMISPLSKKDTLLVNRPFLFQTMPSEKARTDKVSYLLREYGDSINLILIYDGSDKQLKMINRFKNNYTANDTLNIRSDTSVMKTLIYDTDIKMMDAQQEKINKALKKDYLNVVYIPSDNEVFVTQIIDKLYASDKSFRIELIASDKWINFQNINSSVFNRLSFNFVSPLYVDYDSPDVKKFIQKYRSIYQTDPSNFAFEGYDITYYFLNALRRYGRIFQFCLSPEDAFPNRHGLIYDFNFKRTGIYNGFENKDVFILKFDDNFKLVKRNINK
ncbi:MAG: LysM peptidoglycan-binding domain-containing protein [Chlorobi bacterium]|nr:LysM peptidoglycan-binding domain-containing protein [Chlorobiota bacterium]